MKAPRKKRGRPFRSGEAVEFASAKLWRATHGQLLAVVDEVTRKGWAAVGADRSEPPGQASVLDEAVAQLVARMSS